MISMTFYKQDLIAIRDYLTLATNLIDMPNIERVACLHIAEAITKNLVLADWKKQRLFENRRESLNDNISNG